MSMYSGWANININITKYKDLPHWWSVLNTQNPQFNSKNSCLQFFMFHALLMMHNSIQNTIAWNSSCFMHSPLINIISITITLYLCTDGLNPQIKPVSKWSLKPQKKAVQNVGRVGEKRKFSILTSRGTFTSHLDGQKVSFRARVLP